MSTPRVIAWRSGKNFGKWHLAVARDAIRTYCNTSIPEKSQVCESPNLLVTQGPNPDTFCSRCLEEYAKRENT